jgi:outer membrane protein assembly factor BamB
MLKKVVAILLVGALSACGGGGSSSGSENGGSGGGSARTQWSYDVGADTYIYYSSAALSEDEQTIYFGTSRKIRDTASRNDALIALNSDGTLKWRYTLSGGEEVRSTPVVSDGKIYFLADYRTGEFSKTHTSLFALNETDGSLIFEKQVSDNTSMSSTGLSKVVVDDGKVFAIMQHVYAFDASTGDELYKSIELQTNDTYVNPIVLDGEMLFILNGQIYFVSTGNYVTRTVDLSAITNAPVLSTPALDSSKNLYFGTENGEVVAITNSGTLLWEKSLNPSNSPEGPYIRSSIAVDETFGQLYVGTKHNEQSKFLALNTATGDVQWEYATGGDVYSSPLIGNDGSIYFGSESRYVYALDSSGSLLWRESVSQDITWPSPAIDSRGIIYIGGMGNGSGNGKLHAIQTDSTGLSSGVWPKIHRDNQNSGK